MGQFLSILAIKDLSIVGFSRLYTPNNIKIFKLSSIGGGRQRNIRISGQNPTYIL